MGKQQSRKSNSGAMPSHLGSLPFPAELGEQQETIAAKRHASSCWVVIDAAEKIVADQWPLLGQGKT